MHASKLVFKETRRTAMDALAVWAVGRSPWLHCPAMLISKALNFFLAYDENILPKNIPFRI